MSLRSVNQILSVAVLTPPSIHILDQNGMIAFQTLPLGFPSFALPREAAQTIRYGFSYFSHLLQFIIDKGPAT
jgi:hypothetical protein